MRNIRHSFHNAAKIVTVSTLVAVAHFLAIAVLLGVILGGCKLLSPATIRTVLNAADLTCILLEHATDAEVVMNTCKIHAELKPAVEEVISARVAAEKAGFRR